MQDMKTERNEEIANILKTMDEAGFNVLSIRSNEVRIGDRPEVAQNPSREENIYHLTIRIDKGALSNPLAGVISEKATTG